MFDAREMARWFAYYILVCVIGAALGGALAMGLLIWLVSVLT